MMSTVGERIRKRRIELKLSPEDLGNKIGKDRATIYRYEKGEIENLPVGIIAPLATALHTTPQYLMGWEEDPNLTERDNDLDNISDFLFENGYRLSCENYDDDYFLIKKDGETVNSFFVGDLLSIYKNAIKNQTLSIDVFLKNSTNNFIHQIPVLGVVPCGEPIEAIEDIIEWVDVVPSQTKDHFGLIAKGNSMSPYILDGDILIVKYTPEVNSGKIAIVKVNGDDATCKRLMINDAGITLIPNNPLYKTKIFTPQEVQDKPVSIVGEVVEIRRRF
ncbi:peptidase S24-like protein [Bulleidia extructa W1219]|uniref:Peptidase S24-like protein n=2 Tax=Bulleidia TaxID=118747 RepID=D2MPK8_9FIRM|nr:peptidase S24-like protein [Bulleidia extructa W1219]